MRGYIVVTNTQLRGFLDTQQLSGSVIYAPTPQLSGVYGVEEQEEVEYAALEVAREAAEGSGYTIIVALDLPGSVLAQGDEVQPGEIRGNFLIPWDDVDALYLISNIDEELEWYDSSESELCIAQAER